MVKKLKYLLFLIPFLTILNVDATTLNTPSIYYYQNDTPYSVSATTDNWSSTNVFVGPYIGDFGTNTPRITRVDYNWFNLNICSGKNISISGSVHAIFGFFLNQSYTLSFYMNNEQLTCSTQIFDNGNALHYDCFGEVGGGTFSIYLTENSFTPNTNYHTAVSQDVAYSCDVSNEAIVNQSITNTQNIINNQNQNTQDIIDNQNQNTQEQIESQQVCKYIDKSSIEIDGSYLYPDGSIGKNATLGITNYIDIISSKVEVLTTRSGSASLCFYNNNKVLISCITGSNLSLGQLTIPSNSQYFRSSIQKYENKPTFNVCKNGNQALSDSITSEDSPNTSQDISDMDNMVASDTPISDLITMPLTLFNAYINGINSSCSSVNLGNLYGTDIILPCINLESRLGSNLWGIIDALFSLFMCYNIGMLFITAFDGITSLRDDFEGLYQPKHADTGYQPKHGG